MIMGHGKHELRTKKHVVLPKTNCHIPITPLPLHNGHFLLPPRWPLWKGSTVNNANVFGPFFLLYSKQKKKRKKEKKFNSF